MHGLTSTANDAVAELARRHGVTEDAVRTLLSAVSAGGGTMAQFYHPDLGGGGQWLRGGMTMVGDMFNTGLQAKVSALCSDLASLLAGGNVFERVPASPGAPALDTHGGGGSWWPSELLAPSATGGQNDAQYAYFAEPRRLAIRQSGRVTVYDTLDHRIGGVQQQQGGDRGSLTFTSQRGTFAVDALPIASSPSSAAPPSPSKPGASRL